MGLTKAMISYVKNNQVVSIPVHFNPSDYSLTSSNRFEFKEKPGTTETIAQFISGNTEELKMTLYFDTYMDPANSAGTVPGKSKTAKTPEDVRKKYTQKIVELMNIEPGDHAPPVVKFSWGSLTFIGYIESVVQTFTMFLEDGKPVRAKLDVVFKAVDKDTINSRAKPLESPDRTKQRILKGDDQLWTLSNEEYEDPAMWRVIADENKVLNPRKVKSGMVLKLPAIT